jgi:hypothetical protein
MAENKQFKCSGNCLDCLPAQRQYCASQHSYSNMMVLDKMMVLLGKLQEDVATMQSTIQDMGIKIEAIQSSEDSVFDPNGEAVLFPKEFSKKDTAQEEDGANNRSSQK